MAFHCTAAAWSRSIELAVLDDLRVVGEEVRGRLVVVAVERGAPRARDALRRARFRGRRTPASASRGEQDRAEPHTSSVPRVDFELTPEQREIQALAREFARRRDRAARRRVGPRARLPARRCSASSRELGLHGRLRPGGRTAARAPTSSRTSSCSRSCRAPTPASASPSRCTRRACTLPILAFGTDEQRARFVPPLARGERVGCFALTESGAGLGRRRARDARGARSTAAGRSRGAKQWITNGRVRRHVPPLRAHRSRRRARRARRLGVHPRRRARDA